jgi:hypothetical protein
MTLFSSDRLESALSENSLSSWVKTKYFIFIIAAYSMSGPFYFLRPVFGAKQTLLYSLLSLASTALTIAITWFGIKKCYQTNRTTDNDDFLGRFSVLSIPMLFKFIALVFFILIAMGFISLALPFDRKLYGNLIYLLTPVIAYWFYAALNRSFTRLTFLIIERNRRSS